MTYDEYLLALDELQVAYSKQKDECATYDILIKAADLNVGKLTMKLEHLTAALDFSKNKAKVVELRAFTEAKVSLDKCKQEVYLIKTDRLACLKKQKDAQNMLLHLEKQIKTFQENEKVYGKILHHDFRRDSGTNQER